MANDAELLQALQAAHEAGDTEGAIKIAAMLSAKPIDPVVERPNASGSPPPRPPAIDPSAGGGELSIGPISTGIKTPQGVDRFLSGAGQSMMDTYRGIKQLAGFQSPQETDEQRRLDAPLDRTGAGLAGNVAGGIAQFALPGMGAEAAGAKIASRLATSPDALRAAQAVYRIASPAATGAGIGAVAPVGSDETRLGNTGRGAIAGEAGQILGTGAGTVLRAGEDSLTAGARKAADIARKYDIPLQMSQTSGKFTQLLQSALDKFPGSGAEGRADTQKKAFNTALGDISGIDTGGGPLDMEAWQQGRQGVGHAIGNMATGHTAYVTPAELSAVNNILHQVNTKATAENAKIVNNYASEMFGPTSKATPITFPGTQGTTLSIPGEAWRQQNTAIGAHIDRLGENDGDLAHYLSGLKEQYMDSMEHGMPPDQFDAFQGLRHQYSNAMAIKPLVEKAGVGEGVNPNLVQGRAITEGKMFGPSGRPTDLGELAQLGKGPLTSKTPDSGTAQRAAIYAGLTGVAGAGANELFGSGENENGGNQHHDSLGIGIGLPLATIMAGALGSRAMGSRLAAKYTQGRLPEMLARPTESTMGLLPAAVASAAGDVQPGADQSAQPEPRMADGGQPPIQKSSFWDLVKQAYKEITSPSDAANPADAPLGSGAARNAADLIQANPNRIMNQADAQS